jgi:hypothetical protein
MIRLVKISTTIQMDGGSNAHDDSYTASSDGGELYS